MSEAQPLEGLISPFNLRELSRTRVGMQPNLRAIEARII
jgi:hypothetical protein